MRATIKHVSLTTVVYLYTVEGVKSEEEALEAYESGEYDLLDTKIEDSVSWEDPVVISLSPSIRDKALARVRAHDELMEYESEIMYPNQDDEHWRFVCDAPISELVWWAEEERADA